MTSLKFQYNKVQWNRAPRILNFWWNDTCSRFHFSQQHSNICFYVLKTFFAPYIRANSFMSTILTFILFFVYFPSRGRKTYLGPLAGITERLTKNLLLRPFRPGSIDRHCEGESYEWHMFWNITCIELLPKKKIS